jgi:hypothetical protein
MKSFSRNFLLFCWLIIFSSYSFAGGYEACLNKMDRVLRSYIANRQACLTRDTPDLSENSRCMIAETIRFGEESCLSSIKASAKVLNFYWQQVHELDKRLMEKKSATIEEQERWKALMALIKKEEKESDSRGSAELDEISQRDAQSRANDKIINALQLLGATISNSNRRDSPSIISYTIDGKIVTCTTMGSFVNCN